MKKEISYSKQVENKIRKKIKYEIQDLVLNHTDKFLVRIEFDIDRIDFVQMADNVMEDLTKYVMKEYII